MRVHHRSGCRDAVSRRSRHGRRAAIVAVWMVLVQLVPGAASAHVQVIPTRSQPGYAILQFYVFHGCNGAPTERLTIKIPEGVGLARPKVKEGWEISEVRSKYPEPFNVYGEVITEGFTELTWSGGPIPDKYMDSFVISVYFSDRPGKTFRFDVEQWCTGVERPEVSVSEVTLLERPSYPPPSPPPAGRDEPSSGAPAPPTPPAGSAAEKP